MLHYTYIACLVYIKIYNIMLKYFNFGLYVCNEVLRKIVCYCI